MALDLDAIAAHALDVRRAARVRRPPPAGPGTPEAAPEQLLWRRLAVSHVTDRLPAGSHTQAAWGGLQDSAPRAALLSLHARLGDVDPDAWEHPDLVQVWLRWSDYVVPRADVASFTVGAQPRDERVAAALDGLARAAVAALPDGRDSTDAVARRLDLPDPLLLRTVAVTGRIHIRWDARTIDLVAAPPPAVDVEEARAELARRFLHWLGPGTSDHLAKWAGVCRSDAEATWRRLEPELEPVAVAGRRRWLLRDDADALAEATRPTGTRLLPQGDPCLFMAEDLGPPPPKRAPDPASGLTSRLVNSLTGRVVHDGAVVGAWGRAGRRVTIDPWTTMPNGVAGAVDDAAHALREPLGEPVDVRWLPTRTT